MVVFESGRAIRQVAAFTITLSTTSRPGPQNCRCRLCSASGTASCLPLRRQTSFSALRATLAVESTSHPSRGIEESP
eukprot:365188-Chlamydomonas_euryale.AAC.3